MVNCINQWGVDNYAMNGMIFGFPGTGSGVLDCDWRRKLIQNGNEFPFPESRLVFLAKQRVPSPQTTYLSVFGP